MKRVLASAALIAAFFICALGAQAQVTVSGHVFLPTGGAATASSVDVRFILKNFGQVTPRVTSTGTLVTPQRDFTPDGTGLFSGPLFGNDVLTPSGTYYQVLILYRGQNLVPPQTYYITGSTWSLDTALPIVAAPTPVGNILTAKTFEFTQAIPSTTWTINHSFGDRNVVFSCYGTSSTAGTGTQYLIPDTATETSINTLVITFVTPQVGSCNVMNSGNTVLSTAPAGMFLLNANATQTVGTQTTVFTGPAIFEGGAALPSLNNIIFVDGVKYTTIQAAVNALPTVNGKPAGTVYVTNPITIANGQEVTIGPFTKLIFSPTNAVTYTGTGTAFTCNDAPTSYTGDGGIYGLDLNVTNNAGSGFTNTECTWFKLSQVFIQGPGPASTGQAVLFQNTNPNTGSYWTEQSSLQDVHTSNFVNNFVFADNCTGNTGCPSFAYGSWFHVTASPVGASGTGFLLKNDANLNGGDFELRCFSGATPIFCLSLQDTSSIQLVRMKIGGEGPAMTDTGIAVAAGATFSPITLWERWNSPGWTDTNAGSRISYIYNVPGVAQVVGEPTGLLMTPDAAAGYACGASCGSIQFDANTQTAGTFAHIVLPPNLGNASYTPALLQTTQTFTGYNTFNQGLKALAGGTTFSAGLWVSGSASGASVQGLRNDVALANTAINQQQFGEVIVPTFNDSGFSGQTGFGVQIAPTLAMGATGANFANFYALDVTAPAGITNSYAARFNGGSIVLGSVADGCLQTVSNVVTSTLASCGPMPASLTTTAATTDNVTIMGMTASGHCSVTPTNSGAAGGIASVFVSAKTTNQITITHTATAGWTFDILCTPN